LDQIHPLKHADMVEFGAGTGRITTQLIPLVASIRAFDLIPPMIKIANRKLRQSDGSNWLVGVGDSRAMPVPAVSTDIAVEGWSFVQIMRWHVDTWREEVDQAVNEMMRVVRPGGAVILIETLGTGDTTPNPPEIFTTAYDYLKGERNFSSTWIRTDYRFASAVEARDLLEPVFGEGILNGIFESNERIILPDSCTTPELNVPS
jgi:ubiquinone/menaquinone biosynthesis C-methylase UbiE